MIDPALQQLLAVLLGGLLAMGGSIVTNTYVESLRRRQESRNLALAFRGEITALVEHIRERGYVARFEGIIKQVEETREPFHMTFNIRYRYDRVYDENVARLGLLKRPLPEQIPLFYTRLTSVLEDMQNFGGGIYVPVDLATLLRIYRDAHRILVLTVAQGEEILAAITRLYGLEATAQEGPADRVGR